MADQSQSTMPTSHETSQDEGGQAQDRRLDESVMSGKGCEPQDNMQRGMGHGDALKEGVGSDASAAKNSAAKNSGPAAAGSVGNNNNSNTYPYSNHSLI